MARSAYRRPLPFRWMALSGSRHCHRNFIIIPHKSGVRSIHEGLQGTPQVRGYSCNYQKVRRGVDLHTARSPPQAPHEPVSFPGRPPIGVTGRQRDDNQPLLSSRDLSPHTYLLHKRNRRKTLKTNLKEV